MKNISPMRARVALVVIFLSTLSFILPGQVLPDDRNGLMAALPDPLSGEVPVTGAADWESGRRQEILELFRDHVYGRVPDMKINTEFRVSFLDRNALGGKAVMKEVQVKLRGAEDTAQYTLLVLLPAGVSGPVPLFLGLNFYGNQTLLRDTSISITRAWVPGDETFGIEGHRATEASRGVKESRWPVDMILSSGFGLATVYCGEIDPDFDDGFHNGVHALDPAGAEGRTSSSWGTIAAWAWGLSRCMDYFEKDPDVDQHRVAVIGHSRLGKTALWAGAADERFALVISNDAGCGGAALSRRPFGERVADINEVFPHWFASRFHEYSNNEAACPVDQHMLLALVAPRPLYVASAAEDSWADPYGEFLSLSYAGKVYGLYGDKGFTDREMPAVDSPLETRYLGYHIRSGSHDITAYDWEKYLAFATARLKEPSAAPEKNPVSEDWISASLIPGHPRLILTPVLDSLVRRKMKEEDPAVLEGLEYMRETARSFLERPLLEYRKTGRRLLSVSRDAVGRLVTLAFLYRIDREEVYLERLEQELLAVSSFPDWNPSHFLDVAEMAGGVALALDWSGEWLSPEVKALAGRALADKALRPGLDTAYTWFTRVDHNWNLVCNGGLALAALQMFEEEPALATSVLRQSVASMPLALEPYAPDGIYPEGVSYWFFATNYLTAALTAFSTSLGTDFGFGEAPGIRESASVSNILAAPSGEYYNFFDADLEGYRSLIHYGLLAWFASRTGQGMDPGGYRRALHEARDPENRVRYPRYMGVHFLELAKLNSVSGENPAVPLTWAGDGKEPIGVFRDTAAEGHGFFLAAKGGQASDNHGNMDAGSFILETEGKRWSVDPGNQEYHPLEQIIGNDLWDESQGSPRWTLLTKNNFGHSTVSLEGELHRVDGRAILRRFDLRGREPEFTFDLAPVLGNVSGAALRTFRYLGSGRLIIEDTISLPGAGNRVVWQMVTRARVTVLEDRVKLEQEGKVLWILPSADRKFRVRVTDLDPPPLEYDKRIPGLKRIDLVPEAEGEGIHFRVLLEPGTHDLSGSRPRFPAEVSGIPSKS